MEEDFFPSLSSAPRKQPSPSGGHTALPLPVLLPSVWAAARGAAGPGCHCGASAQITCGFCTGVTCPLRRAAAGSAAPSGGVGGKKQKNVSFLTTFVRCGSSRLLLTTKEAGAEGLPRRAGQQMKGAAGTHRVDVFTRSHSFILLQNGVYIQIK